MRAATVLFCGLMLAPPALAQTMTEVSGQPSGEGDPAEVVCRRPMPIPTQRLYGPKICKTNAQWAQYREKGLVLSADGTYEEPANALVACHTQGSVRTRGNIFMPRIMSHVSCE